MQLSDLADQINKLVAEGRGDLEVFIRDGHSGMEYAWGGWVSVETTDEEADGELSELVEGTDYISLGFG